MDYRQITVSTKTYSNKVYIIIIQHRHIKQRNLQPSVSYIHGVFFKISSVHICRLIFYFYLKKVQRNSIKNFFVNLNKWVLKPFNNSNFKQKLNLSSTTRNNQYYFLQLPEQSICKLIRLMVAIINNLLTTSFFAVFHQKCVLLLEQKIKQSIRTKANVFECRQQVANRFFFCDCVAYIFGQVNFSSWSWKI